MVEILIYTFLVIFASAVAVRTTFPFVEARRLRTAAIELSGYLQVARSVAMATNVPCIIDLSQNEGGVFQSITTETNNSCKPDAGNIFPSVNLGEFAASRNLRADVLTSSGSFPITFTPDGTINSGVTVLLSSSDVPAVVWCVNVQAPLATVRIGWRADSAPEGKCNYSAEL